MTTLGVDESFIHVNINHVGAAFDLLSGDCRAPSRSFSPNKARKFWEPVMLVRSPTITKLKASSTCNGSRPLSVDGCREAWRADRKSTDGFFHGINMFGGGAAATAPDSS